MRIIRLFMACFFLFVPGCGDQGGVGQEDLLKDKDRDFIRATLEDMDGEVTLVLFTKPKDCEYCGLTEGFLKDIVALSPKVSLEVLSLEEDKVRASELGIDKAPGIAFLGKKNPGIRYYGLPTGYEFIAFVETIRHVAEETPALMPETIEGLASLTKPATITIFSTKS